MTVCTAPLEHAERDPRVDRILADVHRRTGIDFSRYRRTTVVRRIGNRMISLGITGLDEYASLLAAHDEEAWHLVERLTIKVSRFYRDVATFDAIRRSVLPALAVVARTRPLRLWSAGCGRGEEPYTLAMLLESAGMHGTVDATDIDPRALDAARKASYREDSLEGLPRDLSERYLEPPPDAKAGCWSVRGAIRARVRFTRHDLTSVAPPPRGPFDLVACCNVLIYLEPEAHSQAVDTLAAALAPSGFLCLGEVEGPPPGFCNAFSTAPRARVFSRTCVHPGGIA